MIKNEVIVKNENENKKKNNNDNDFKNREIMIQNYQIQNPYNMNNIYKNKQFNRNKNNILINLKKKN